jgi:hypothetical protein
MSHAKSGMILDRVLDPNLLDVAFRVAIADTPQSEKRRLLTVALRDHVSHQEAEGKTKKCLTHVWLNPPEDAGAMISWARDHSQLATDRRIMHIGALLATFPFAGAVAAAIGRALALDGQAEPTDIRRRAKAIWGDRSSIDVGARKTYTTLIRLGVLDGGGRRPLSRGAVFEADAEAASWLIHALMLTRGVDSVSDAEVAVAPELFWAKILRPDGEYWLIDRHSEGGRRTVWTTRR